MVKYNNKQIMKEKQTQETKFCRLHQSGAVDSQCKEQCVDCFSKELRDQVQDEKLEMDVNKVNAYTCGTCAKNTVIKHREKGVTPFFISCIHCGGQAISHMYKVPQDLEHDLVAFKPNGKMEWKLYEKYLKGYYGKEAPTAKAMHSIMESVKAHVRKGGLVMISADRLKIN